jgi:hypothetical protein
MSCKAEIVVEQYPSAVYVPIQSVVRIGGRPTVFVKSGAGHAPRSVDLGLDNNRMVRIVAGLQPGEQVLLAPPLSQAAAAAAPGRAEAATVKEGERPRKAADGSAAEPRGPGKATGARQKGTGRARPGQPRPPGAGRRPAEQP